VDVIPGLDGLLSQARLVSGLSKVETASALGVSPSLIGLYERGKRSPTRSRAFALAGRIGDVNVSSKIASLASHPVFWDRVAEVRRLTDHQQEHVYDLTVPGTHTFLIGAAGIVAHNTTLLGALGLAIDDPDQRIITLEETRELALDLYLPRCSSWQGRPRNTEGKGQITLRELLQEDALRMEPARIILGEARGAEALDILRAMNTGHQGSLTSVHASSARQALTALRNLALQSPDRFDVETITALVADAVDIVIHMRKVRQPGGGFRREVSEIFELVDQEHPLRFNGQALWVRDHHGTLVRTGIRPRCLARIEEAEVPYRWEPLP
jgi:Flp pilus assembly CpaF family ATPase